MASTVASGSRARKTATTLAGLGLAAHIVREATDDVPIVKEVFGVLARILGHAEKIDKNREALHELADKAARHSKTIEALLASGTPELTVSQCLERIIQVFTGVERFMEAFRAKSRFRRTVSYVFTVPQHVERMTNEMSDALEEFTLVALNAIHQRVNDTHRAVQETAPYDGEFHRIRAGDVQKQDLFYQKASANGTSIVKYHRAQVKGQLLVVRLFEENASTSEIAGETLIDRAISHDRILMEVSSIRTSHQHVTSIYGWGSGSTRDRATVFKSGYAPLDEARKRGAVSGAGYFMRMAYKLLDAARHLEQTGIVWFPDDPSTVFVDEHGEPTIGLTGELNAGVSPEEHASVYMDQLLILKNICEEFVRWKPVASRSGRAEWQDARLVQLLENPEVTVKIERLSLARPDFEHYLIHSQVTADYLRKAHAAGACSKLPEQVVPLGDLLLSLRPEGRRDGTREATITANYFLHQDSIEDDDQLVIVRVREDSETSLYERLHLFIPREESVEAREIFGITVPADSPPLEEDDDRLFIFPVSGL